MVEHVSKTLTTLIWGCVICWLHFVSIALSVTASFQATRTAPFQQDRRLSQEAFLAECRYHEITSVITSKLRLLIN